MSHRTSLIAGNWKMNTTLGAAVDLAKKVAAAAAKAPQIDVLVCPPFPYLLAVREALGTSKAALGAQNVYCEPPGAFTGEVAVEMLLDVGCRYVILGHSERRHILGENDTLVNKKVKASLAKGLDVILCVGELLEERQAGRAEAVLDRQMAGGLAEVAAEALSHVVIAYEPVWAIGTGVTASPEQADSAHAHLRKWLGVRYNPQVADKTRILYGGSVKPDNAASLLSLPNVDGALVGGASLKAEQFVPIIDAAAGLIGSGH
jgi:triosephosphate isomerase